MQCMLTNAMRGLRNWRSLLLKLCFFMGLTHDPVSQPWGGKFSSSCIKFRTVFNCHPGEVLQPLAHISAAFPWPRFLHLFKYLNIHWQRYTPGELHYGMAGSCLLQAEQKEPMAAGLPNGPWPPSQSHWAAAAISPELQRCCCPKPGWATPEETGRGKTHWMEPETQAPAPAAW